MKLDPFHLLFGKGGDEEVFIGDMRSDVLLCTELLCFLLGDKPPFEFSSEDALGGTEVVGVDIGHEGDEFVYEQCARRG